MCYEKTVQTPFTTERKRQRRITSAVLPVIILLSEKPAENPQTTLTALLSKEQSKTAMLNKAWPFCTGVRLC